jgi:ATP-dependent 26S proteasome regulatory subunit
MNNRDVFNNIKDLIKANYPLIYAITTEYSRTLQYIRSIARQHGFSFYVWDCTAGLVEHHRGNDGKYQRKPIEGCDDYNGLIDYILHRIEEQDTQDAPEIYLLEDYHRYFDQPDTFTRLRKIAEQLKYYNKHVILSGPFVKMPDELEKFVTVVNIPLPDRRDLEKQLNSVVNGEKLDEDLKKFFIDAALGMTDMEAGLAFRLAKTKVGLHQKEAAEVIAQEKEQIIKKSGILDYYQVDEQLEKSLGGLENLKTWLRQRNKAFERKAKQFGLKEPKGMLLVGVPGCGKSLTAKCIASEWKQPLLKLDVGKVFQAEVGASENNIRLAIATAEAVAPCVLWIDEIEKGLNTGGGEQDGGTNARVFSTILTWMQEKTKPVFVVATANNIQSLPPELLRKGRFDEIFFVDLPTKEERINIFKIHLAKYRQTTVTGLETLADKTQFFNGAEIEECVKEAMFIAYNENPDVEQVSMRHLMQAIEPIVPLAKTMANQIKFLREFGKSKRARPASKEPNTEHLATEEEPNKAVIRTKAEREQDIYEFEQPEG